MEEIKIKVDKERRNKIKKLHTATHIINYASREVLGNHIWQNGSHIKENFATLDITHYKLLTREEIKKIEFLSNLIVFQKKRVTIEELERTEAEKRYNFTIYQGGAIPLKKLRIVKIDDVDVEACGGLHVFNTSEIGLIKVYNTEKIQDGLIRLYFKVHEDALADFQEIEDYLNEVSTYFNINYKDVFKTALKFFNSQKEVSKEVENLKNEFIKLLKNEIINSDKRVYKLNINLDVPDIFSIFSALNKSKIIVLKCKNIVATNDNDFKLDSYKKELNKKNLKIFILE